MGGKVVTVKSIDSVRIEVLGEARAVTIPAELLLAADLVLRNVLDQIGCLKVAEVAGPPNDPAWMSTFHSRGDSKWDRSAWGHTPWESIKLLAREMENRSNAT